MSTIQPSLIATLATGPAIEDLRTLLFSLSLFNTPAPTVYLFCDTAIAAAIPTLKYPGRIVRRPDLDRYSGLDRKTMEYAPGTVYPTLWFEFMAEKINLLEWVFKTETVEAATRGVLFCDADICFTAPLPQIPAVAEVALSPHDIRPTDEARYGRYNGGFAWFRTAAHVATWRTACLAGSRFFEQSALEDVASAVGDRPGPLYHFPRTQNYGWWRLLQGSAPVETLQHEWTMNRAKAAGASGILINGEPLGSVHTHFQETHDAATHYFNQWVRGWLQRLAGGHLPARRLLAHLQNRPRPHQN